MKKKERKRIQKRVFSRWCERVELAVHRHASQWLDQAEHNADLTARIANLDRFRDQAEEDIEALYNRKAIEAQEPAEPLNEWGKAVSNLLDARPEVRLDDVAEEVMDQYREEGEYVQHLLADEDDEDRVVITRFAARQTAAIAKSVIGQNNNYAWWYPMIQMWADLGDKMD